MITKEELETIKKVVTEFLQHMQAGSFALEVEGGQEGDGATVAIEAAEPPFLIGQEGKTLIDLQRLVKMVVHKKLGRPVPLALDVNHYRAQKTEHLKKMAREAADQVALTGIVKTLAPMSSYERRIVHAELAKRSDVTTQSQGEGEERSVVISPR